MRQGTNPPGHWLGVVAEEQFADERLYARERVSVPIGPGGSAPAEGDAVVLVSGGTSGVLFGHGVVRGVADGLVSVEYRGRLFDEPPPVPADVVPADAVPADVGAAGSVPGLYPLPPSQFTRLAALVRASAEAGDGQSVWFVSLALPIEARSAAEAVREFWTYVDKLGPQELPAYVWPLGDELAMRAFVLGAVTNLDPEEDDD